MVKSFQEGLRVVMAIGINRVERTARLMGAKGSAADRNKLASNLNKRFYVMVTDTISKRVQKGKQAYINANEIGKHIEKLAQGVLLYLEKAVDPIYGGFVMPHQLKGNVNSIFGLEMALPFVKRGNTNILREDDLDLLMHESRHFFDMITQPKHLAKENHFARIKQSGHWKFYEKNVYTTHENMTGSDVKVGLKSMINIHFDKRKTSLADRINVLQYWRYSVLTELNAFKDQTFYCAKPVYKQLKQKILSGEKVNISTENDLGNGFNSEEFSTKKDRIKGFLNFEKQDFEHNKKTDIYEEYFFNEKLNLIEELLAESIAKARAKHKNIINKDLM